MLSDAFRLLSRLQIHPIAPIHVLRHFLDDICSIGLWPLCRTPSHSSETDYLYTIIFVSDWIPWTKDPVSRKSDFSWGRHWFWTPNIQSRFSWHPTQHLLNSQSIRSAISSLGSSPVLPPLSYHVVFICALPSQPCCWFQWLLGSCLAIDHSFFKPYYYTLYTTDSERQRFRLSQWSLDCLGYFAWELCATVPRERVTSFILYP